MKLISKAAFIAAVAGSSLIAGATQASQGEMLYSSKDLRAVEVSIPEYPRRAELSGVEGYTIIDFTVLPDGSVVEPAVRVSNSRLFSRAALAAIEEWKFEPVVAEAGEAIQVRSSLKFNFVGRN